MRFELLGPLVVKDDAEMPVTVGSDRARHVLTVQLLHKNQPVSSVRLARLLTDADLGLATGTVRTYVAMLRRIPSIARRLNTTSSGYVLEIRPGELDIDDFMELSADGRGALDRGDPHEAVRLLSTALGLWREPYLRDVPPPMADESVVSSLLEKRRLAFENLADARLALGHHRQIIGELRAQVHSHPRHERAWWQLMLALYRSGRQGEAFEAYHRLRAMLAEDYGTTPGREVRELYDNILHQSVELTATRSESVPTCDREVQPDGDMSGSSWVGPGNAMRVPRQLPHVPGRFVGRGAQLEVLNGLAQRAVDGESTTIATISGSPGVGKSALAVYAGQVVAHQFPDGQLYVDLRGFDASGSPAKPSDALPRLLNGLGVSPARVPWGRPAQACLYRSLLAGGRYLLVIDNARDASQVRQLVPGGRSCLVIVTSRNTMSSLVAIGGAHPVTLGPLGKEDAIELLAARLGRARVMADPAASSELADLCDRMPLALVIAAARALGGPQQSLSSLVKELRSPRDRLSVLSTGDHSGDLRTVISWSYNDMSGPAARLFLQLGRARRGDVSDVSAAACCEISVPEAHRLLQELARASLIVEYASCRYRLPALIRAYATELADAESGLLPVDSLS